MDQQTLLSLLSDHPVIRGVLLRDVQDAIGRDRQIGYVVIKASAELTPEELRTHYYIKNIEPELIPDYIFVLKDLPFKTDGSIDAEKLPLPENNGPRDATDLILQQIWEELLGKKCGIDDDFFGEGGHSLQAVEMLAHIEGKAGISLPASTLLTASTIRTLSDAMVAQSCDASQPSIVQVNQSALDQFNQDKDTAPFFLLHGDYTGGGFFSRHIAAHAELDDPFYIVQPFGLQRNDSSPLPDSIEEMAALHLEAIRSLQPEGPYRLGGYCNAALIVYEIAHLLTQSGSEVEFLLLIDPPNPKKLAKFPDYMSKSLDDYRARRKQLGKPVPKDKEIEHRNWLLSHYNRITAQYDAEPYAGTVHLVAFTHKQAEQWQQMAEKCEYIPVEIDSEKHGEAIVKSAGQIGVALGNLLVPEANTSHGAEPGVS
ncbi:thioesterase domain-containing protein [Solemya velum gill symbiont]|nr:thioesterase domain-containing protein [Solemya velum gill symbiont]